MPCWIEVEMTLLKELLRGRPESSVAELAPVRRADQQPELMPGPLPSRAQRQRRVATRPGKWPPPHQFLARTTDSCESPPGSHPRSTRSLRSPRPARDWATLRWE